MQVDEGKENRKKELAMQFSKGEVNVLQCEDVFEGLTPEVRIIPPDAAQTCQMDRIILLPTFQMAHLLHSICSNLEHLFGSPAFAAHRPWNA